MRLVGRSTGRALWVALECAGWTLLLAASGCAARALVDTPLVAGRAPAEPERMSVQPLRPEPLQPLRPEPLQELWREVASARGLQSGPLPPVLELPAQELARRALEQVARDVPEAVRRAQALLLRRLELVPPDFDLSLTLEHALAGQLQALYVGSPPSVFVDRALAAGARRRALGHELVHALQDQRHALTRRLAYEPGGWDRQNALHALAEADAVALVERLGGELSADAGGSAPALPGVIACSLAAPYLDGRARVDELLAQGGFGALDAVLDSPPPSTHQLLHPGEPSASGVEPVRAPGSEWTVVYDDVLGEQSLRCVLEEWLAGPLAAELAGGWAADRVTSFASGAQTAIVWELRLARPAQAAQVARLLVAHLGLEPSSGRAPTPVSEWLCGAHSDSGVVAIWRQAARVVFASLSVPLPGGCVSLAGWLRSLALSGPS